MIWFLQAAGLVAIPTGIGALIAAIPCGFAWWLTKRLPSWLWLLIVTFIAALISTPAVVGSEGGIGILPMIFIVIQFLHHLFNLYCGIDDADPTISHPGIQEIISIGIAWALLYSISMAIVAIRSLNKKSRSQNRPPLTKLSIPPSGSI
jgi:hypothetical protein